MASNKIAIIHDASDYSGKSVSVDGHVIPGQIQEIGLETYAGGIEVKVTLVFWVNEVKAV